MMKSVMWFGLIALPVGILVGLAVGCSQRGEQVLPHEQHGLEFKLYAPHDGYTLDLKGRSPLAFTTELDQQAKALHYSGPAYFREGHTVHRTPTVDLKLEVRNTKEEEVVVSFSFSDMQMEVHGPAVLSVEGPPAPPPEAAPATPTRRAIKLGPKESYFATIPQLELPHPMHVRRWYWVQPGQYEVRVIWKMPRSGAIHYKPILVSNAVKLQVQRKPTIREAKAQ